MEFLSTLVMTLLKMVIVGAFAFGGIQFGRFMRKKKDAKEADNV